MRAPRILTLAGLAAVSWAPAVGAQEGASRTVDGFNGMPWGASVSEIESTYGAPRQTDTLENGIVVLSYDDELFDHSVVTLYAVLEGQGLIKGQQVARLDLEAGDCEAQYRRYRDLVTLHFPLIVPIENFDYPFTMTFCEAVEARSGTWGTQWRDEGTGSVVTVIVEEGTDFVKLIYESRAFLEWLGAASSPAEGPEQD